VHLCAHARGYTVRVSQASFSQAFLRKCERRQRSKLHWFVRAWKSDEEDPLKEIGPLTLFIPSVIWDRTYIQSRRPHEAHCQSETQRYSQCDKS
jgi:hypothetical protein